MRIKETAFFTYLTLFVIFSFVFGCSQTVTVPQHLIGVWKTSAPKYADRHFAFDEYYVSFGVGGGEELFHPIREIETDEDSKGTTYTIHYEDAEKEEWTLEISYNPENGGIVRMKNSNDIWKKIESGDQ
jgi:hypothetical protein